VAPSYTKAEREAMNNVRRTRQGLWRSAVVGLHGFEFRWIVDALAAMRAHDRAQNRAA
jgi:hypothetical protein